MDIKVKDMTRETSTGLVTKVVYSFSKTSGDHTAHYRNAEMHFEGDADADDFVAYDSLTSATVEGWIRNAHDQDRLDEIEDILDAKLAEIATPTTSNGLPWSD